jgi:hypothetical protein
MVARGGGQQYTLKGSVHWDADFLYGPRTATGEDNYVLCEINVSSVFAIPEEAPAAIARLALKRCSARDLLNEPLR